MRQTRASPRRNAAWRRRVRCSAAAGIVAGDRILGVNDTVVGRIAAYEDVLSRLPRGAYVARLEMRVGRHACIAIDPGIEP